MAKVCGQRAFIHRDRAASLLPYLASQSNPIIDLWQRKICKNTYQYAINALELYYNVVVSGLSSSEFATFYTWWSSSQISINPFKWPRDAIVINPRPTTGSSSGEA